MLKFTFKPATRCLALLLFVAVGSITEAKATVADLDFSDIGSAKLLGHEDLEYFDFGSGREKGVQYLLRARGYSIEIDGVLGPQSQDRIRRFQHSNGLPPNGVLDDGDMWLKLTPALRPGSHGDAVRAIQSMLNACKKDDAASGYTLAYKVNIDGQFGPQTLRALKRLQRDNYLDDDGIIGADTWRVLAGLPMGGGN